MKTLGESALAWLGGEGALEEMAMPTGGQRGACRDRVCSSDGNNRCPQTAIVIPGGWSEMGGGRGGARAVLGFL